MELPIFELMISDDLNDDAEVNFVALVDRPAIQRNWNAFKEHIKFEIVSEDKRIISGALMLADTPIFRSDSTHGDYYVMFSKDTIFKIAQKFFKKGYQANVNLMHDPSQRVDGVTMFESFISDKDRGVAPMKGFEDAPDGSWFGSFKVEDDETWQKVKNGEVKGFSVEGIFEYSKAKSKEEQMMERIYKILEELDFGGEGSGCKGDNCGRPKGSGEEVSAPKINYSNPEVLKESVDRILAEPPKYGTQEIFSKDGVYNDERQTFHKEVIADYMKDGSTNTGVSYFMGGAPATGKSSIINSGDVVLPQGILVVDSDAIKAKLPEYEEMVNRGEKEAAARVHEESSTLSKAITATAAKNGYDIVNDGVGDGKYESIVKKVEEQREAGKKVVANYVTTDTETSLQRARQRGERTGRVVPEEYIKSMHREISGLVPKLAQNKVFDELRLYDNNGAKPKLIFEQKGSKITVHDQAAYNKFLAKAKG